MTLTNQTKTGRGHRRVAHGVAFAGVLAALSAMYFRSRMGNGEVTWALATAGATAALALTGLGWLGLGWSLRRRVASISPGATLSLAALGALGLLGAGYVGASLLRVGDSFPSVRPLWVLTLVAAMLALAVSVVWALGVAARAVARSPVAAGWSALLLRWRSFPFSERVFAVLVAGLLGWELLLQSVLDESPWALEAVPPGVALLGGLAATHGRRGELRAGTVVVLAAVLHLGFLGMHIHHRGLAEFAMLGPASIADHEIRWLLPSYGRALLESGLPAVEYPPGAIATFALATVLGPFPFSFPLLVLPLLLGAWWGIARLGPDAPWLAACAAFWSTIVPFWEVKFETLPAGLLILGLVAASRRSWAWAGLLLGLGAASKWYPGLAVPILALGLLRRRELESATRLVGAAAVAFLVFTLPFLGQIDALLSPYRFQAARGVTGESLPFLPVHLIGLATPPGRPWDPAGVPTWLAGASMAAIAVALVTLAIAAWRRPERALVLAAAAPAAFLLLNRIFSPQFIVPLAALWVFAAAVQPWSPRRRMATVALLGVAATANWAVWPSSTDDWIVMEWVLFAAAVGASVVAFSPGRRSAHRREPPRSVGTSVASAQETPAAA
ncbi:MAG: glycosyltransferase 87 family protein [Thermoleophilaceae bacterium]